MRCFQHTDRDAVGICGSCGKGLCAECAVDLGKGLACRGRCEEDVRARIRWVERNLQLSAESAGLMRSIAGRWMGSAIFNLACGVVFLVWGIVESGRLKGLVVLGLCFLGAGIFHVLQAWRLRRGGS